MKTTNEQTEAMVAFGLAAAAAVLIKIPELFGTSLDQNEGFYLRNMSLFTLPLLTVYFAWKRKMSTHTRPWLAAAFIAAIVVANVYPFIPGGDTGVLMALHLPVALWLIVGIAYTGGHWSETESRMDFIRFSGELFIYYVLIGLGGMALTGFMALIFGTIEIDIEPVFESWLLPCGAVGAVLVASWLVERRQNMIEHFAPVLARLFSPLFALVLLVFLGTLIYTGRALEIERDVLLAFDLLLLVVIGLLLYSVSARDPESPAGAYDAVQLLLVVSALLADGIALWAITARITEWGFTPNRVVALGLNVILMVNLAGSAVLYIRYMRKQGSFSALERWQTAYLPVYAAWASAVVILIPPLFGYT